MQSSTSSSITSLEAAPPTVVEQKIAFFKFYLNKSIQEGGVYSNELYRIEKQFPVGDRLEAYRRGYELIGQDIPSLISVSNQRYIVWTKLGSPRK